MKVKPIKTEATPTLNFFNRKPLVLFVLASLTFHFDYDLITYSQKPFQKIHGLFYTAYYI
jgi:hypothetical protein